MLDNNLRILPEDVHSVPWEGDSLYYDLQLYQLGQGRAEFWVLNPEFENDRYHHFIDALPDTRKCIVVSFNGTWLAKIFKDGWYPYHGYETVELTIPKLVWTRNPDIDSRMTFDVDPRTEYQLDFWDKDYELVWKLDPRFFPDDGEVRVYTAKVIGNKSTRTKFMGYLVPDVDVEFNDVLPDLGINVDDCCPAFWDLSYECAYELDPAFQTAELEERMWVVKFKPNWRKPKDWKWYGTITPQYKIVSNPDLPKLTADIDYVIPWHDLKYEHIWMLDDKHTKNATEPIWAFKVRATDYVEGATIAGTVELEGKLEYNPGVTVPFSLPEDFVVQHYDIGYQFVWVAKEDTEKIWVAKLSYVDNPVGVKEIEITDEIVTDRMDVVFISYNEPNAEQNWLRVLEKAPYAKRVSGVKGIFNAHKKAAKIADTDMFYVVDGDAWLADDWEFDFDPGIFDRDCAYVWYCKNPINDLLYENGGVKLFPRKEMLSVSKWRTLDMYTGVTSKKKSMSRVSCLTTFNSDEFSTWRSAFRESVKLFINNKMNYLDAWMSKGADRPFGNYAIRGAIEGYEFAKKYSHKIETLAHINNYAWLRKKFEHSESINK
jgi:hypothetical protein